jgi:hypothetical protein
MIKNDTRFNVAKEVKSEKRKTCNSLIVGSLSRKSDGYKTIATLVEKSFCMSLGCLSLEPVL